MNKKTFEAIGFEDLIQKIRSEMQGSSDFNLEESNFQVTVTTKDYKEMERLSLFVEPNAITLEVGVGLVPLVENEKNGETLEDKIMLMRKNIAHKFGFVIPPIYVIDNSALMPYTKYNILIKDSVVASGELRINHFLALKTPFVLREVNGIPTKDPIFGEDALWVTEEGVTEAHQLGYTILDPLQILSTHLHESIRSNFSTLISRQYIKNLLEELRDRHYVLLEELQAKQIDLSLVQKVIQNLLSEEISIRHLPAIIETIIDYSTSNADIVTTCVRERLAAQICQNLKSDDGKLYVLLLDKDIEINTKVNLRRDSYYLNISVSEERSLIESILEHIEKAQFAEVNPVILTGRSELRSGLARLIKKYNIPISVLSASELIPGVHVERLDIISPKAE